MGFEEELQQLFLQFLISSLTTEPFTVDQGVLAMRAREPRVEAVLSRRVSAGEGSWKQRLGAVGDVGDLCSGMCVFRV